MKTDITTRQYCGLAIQEYFAFLVSDESRWTDWLANNPDPNDPTGATSSETIQPCGKTITITATQQAVLPPGSADDPVGAPVGMIPPLSAYGNRNFHTRKTVSDSNPDAGETVTYTITVVNRDSTATTLTKIEETLPPGFLYDCNAAVNQLTLPGAAPVDIYPGHNLCPDTDEKDKVDWHMPSGTSIPSGGVVTLTFGAITSVIPGTYCNETQVSPGGNKTRSGKTAIVQIGVVPGLCAGEAVSVSKVLDSVSYASTDVNTSPYTDSFNANYSITIENIGTGNVTLKEFIDLLPVGFSYFSTDPNGDITDIPDQLHHEHQVDRQRVTWKFNPEISLPPGESQTLIFTTVASVTRGVYWSDLLVDFGSGASRKTSILGQRQQSRPWTLTP